MTVADPLTLPISGRTLSNRLVKAALTESLADPNTSQPNEQHWRLYSQWKGCGMVQSGNVMVDRRHRESTRNVVLDDASDLAAFSKWADAIHNTSTSNNTSKSTTNSSTITRNKNSSNSQTTLAIMQISHPGRQCPVACTAGEITPVAPSSGLQARLVLPGKMGDQLGKWLVVPARELAEDELPAIVQQYAVAAILAEDAGWDGVEIHGAHGYLLSQFLSPSANQRTDAYGGTAEKRQKLFFEVIAAVRSATSKDFVVGVKINTKDRSKDGVEREDECIQLIQALSKLETLDFIELSGGGFEDAMFVHNPNNSDDNDDAPEQQQQPSKGLFAAFAERVHTEVPRTDKSPKICLTGGFRTKSGMEEALLQDEEGGGYCDLIGLGRPIIVNPTFAQDILDDRQTQSTCVPLSVPVFRELLEAALNSLWYQRQLHRISLGQRPDPNLSYLYTLAVTFFCSYIYDFQFKGHKQQQQQGSTTTASSSDKNKEE